MVLRRHTSSRGGEFRTLPAPASQSSLETRVFPRVSHRDRRYNPRNYVRRLATRQGRLIGPGVTSEHSAMSLECIQLGRDRGSSQLSFQCCKQPLHVLLFEVKLMCRRRGENLKEDQLMRVALS